jgi:hypothetical protein
MSITLNGITAHTGINDHGHEILNAYNCKGDNSKSIPNYNKFLVIKNPIGLL